MTVPLTEHDSAVKFQEFLTANPTVSAYMLKALQSRLDTQAKTTIVAKAKLDHAQGSLAFELKLDIDFTKSGINPIGQGLVSKAQTFLDVRLRNLKNEMYGYLEEGLPLNDVTMTAGQANAQLAIQQQG